MKRLVLSLTLAFLFTVSAAAQVASAVNVEGFSDEASARSVFSAKSGVGKLFIPMRIVNPNGGADRVTYLVVYQVPLWQYELGIGTYVQNAGLPPHNGTLQSGGYWWLGNLTSTLYTTESAALTAASNTPSDARTTLRLSQRATQQSADWEFTVQTYTFGMSLP